MPPPAGAPPEKAVTQLLLDWKNGNQEALHLLVPLVYGELRRLADRCLRDERTAATIQPTTLVHEAYPRLVSQNLPGNIDGYVDTSRATETITALSPTSPTGVVFEEWKVFCPPVPPTGTPTFQIAGAKLTVERGTSAYALAFYKVNPGRSVRARNLRISTPATFLHSPRMRRLAHWCWKS
jgi:hypothetical protein